MELERAAGLWPRSVKFRARRSVWRARELERRARRSPRYLREPLPMLEERSVRGAKKLAANPARQEKKLPSALKSGQRYCQDSRENQREKPATSLGLCLLSEGRLLYRPQSC